MDSVGLVMIYLFIIGLVSYLIILSDQRLHDDASPNNEVIVNSDDDDLNQALLLIDMLKSEYLKLLRDRSGVAETGTADVEQSTCAATIGLQSVTFSSTPKENIPTSVLIPHKEYREPARTTAESAPSFAPPPWQSKVAPAAPLYPWQGTHIGTASTHGMPISQFSNMPRRSRQRPLLRRLGGRWRWFFPDYHIYNVHPRRFNYDPPVKKRPTSPYTGANTIAVHATAIFTEDLGKNTKTVSGPSTVSSKTAIFSTMNHVRTTTTKRRPTLTTPQPTTTKVTFLKKTSKRIKTKSVTITTKNLLEAEVASELLNEFKQINITLKAKTSKTSVDSASAE